MSNVEEKKWLISRLDLYYRLGIEGFQTDQKKHESYFEKGISKLQGIRNGILTGIGAVVTILISIMPIFRLDLFLVHILGIGGLAGMIIIMIFNAAIKWTEDVSLSYSEIYEENISKLVFSQGYLTTRVAKLSGANYEYIENFYIFTMTLAAAIQLDSAKSLKTLVKKYAKHSPIKSAIEDETKIFEEYSELIFFYYPKINRSLDTPPKLLDFIDNVYKEYKKIIL